jgi:dCMP deaminase
MKKKFIEAYMDVAERFSQLSSAKRLQVGAIVVKDDRIISIGYNGMPAGCDNNCEDREWMDSIKAPMAI